MATTWYLERRGTATALPERSSRGRDRRGIVRIAVVGSGFGGLAAAIRLAVRGHEVTLLEKRDRPGGRAYVYERDGFTFDGGPTVITAPWLLEELFTLAGRDPAGYMQLVPIDPFYRIFFSDGASFDYSGDGERMAAQIA